ncbi:helix-turn-helix domain-containing protein [Fodinicola acaciae]|uniref:helix-turn-helix domain-containing protein n=1 Tax=Fodinicola acaciae TaxID=2681555 RepID=UPI0013D61820|nr:helix-turn-helix transcriptional regulator [Fodinicola acaciae]
MGEPTIGALLRELREKAERSQSEQADELSAILGRPVTRNEVSRWENEKRLLTPYMQQPYADSFKVDVTVIRRAVAQAKANRRRTRPDAEEERDPVQRREFLGAVAGLALAGATGQPSLGATNGVPQLAGLDQIRAALTSYTLKTPALSVADLDTVRDLTVETHRRYQAADYSGAAQVLPALIVTADGLVAQSTGDDLRAALAVQNQVYVATAKLVTKVGDGNLAWIAADRAATAAQRADSPILKATAAFQLSCALLRLDNIDDAERIATDAAEGFRDDSPDGLSVRGALWLNSALIASRRSDRAASTERMRQAEQLALELGHDGNYVWTAFGPTNVAIHQLSAAVEIHDPRSAIARAERVDTSTMPGGLRSRRAQVHIDTAWAYTQDRTDPAVVINLMEAERVAPEAVHYNGKVRQMLTEMLKRERKSATPGLRELAQRCGVLL